MGLKGDENAKIRAVNSFKMGLGVVSAQTNWKSDEKKFPLSSLELMTAVSDLQSAKLLKFSN